MYATQKAIRSPPPPPLVKQVIDDWRPCTGDSCPLKSCTQAGRNYLNTPMVMMWGFMSSDVGLTY